MDDRESPFVAPLEPIVLEPVANDDDVRTRCGRALDACDSSWCDVGGCDLPCDLLELASVLDGCDVGCL